MRDYAMYYGLQEQSLASEPDKLKGRPMADIETRLLGPTIADYRRSMAEVAIKHHEQVIKVEENRALCPKLNEIKAHYRRLGNTAI